MGRYVNGIGLPAGRSRRAAVAFALVALLVAGCGQQAGALLYFLGLYPRQKVPAEFNLTPGRLAVLIDDDADQVTYPEVYRQFTEEFATALRENKQVTQVIPYEQLKELQQRDPEFDQIAADRVGKLLEADQVLWIKVDRFDTGGIGTSDISQAAAFSISLRVLTTRAKSRDEVQLWPDTREPRAVSAALTMSAVQQQNDPRVIAGMLAEQLAADVARLFYEYELDEMTS
jgi:hypothetical protein